MPFQDPSEEFVFNLCRSTFLSLWSYANPRRDGSSKELCDILVVCYPHVIIFSVKYSEYQDTGDPVGAKRWQSRTVDASVKQIYGAERNLLQASHVTRSDGEQGLPLPALAERKVHRIAVSLGGNRSVMMKSGDFGKGYVHCFDDKFVWVALSELTTVSDFIGYLEATEGLAKRNQRVVMLGGEEDLLAVYLHGGRKFTEHDVLMVSDDCWDGFHKGPHFQRRTEADRISYKWDVLIEGLASSVLGDQLEPVGAPSDDERVFRAMVRENRLSRRLLAGALLEFLELAKAGKVRARMTQGTGGVTYVFFHAPSSYDVKQRTAELGCRCLVARDKIPENQSVVGIGFNFESTPQGYSTEIFYGYFPEWSEEDKRRADEISRELDFFQAPLAQKGRVDEYPEE